MTPEDAVDLYIAAWNVADDGERLELVRRAFTDDAARVGRDVRHGPDAIASTMSRIEARRTSALELQHGWSRFEWEAFADGERLAGVDVVEHADDGRIKRLVVFYTPRVP
jgi:hypothetical protein